MADGYVDYPPFDTPIRRAPLHHHGYGTKLTTRQLREWEKEKHRIESPKIEKLHAGPSKRRCSELIFGLPAVPPGAPSSSPHRGTRFPSQEHKLISQVNCLNSFCFVLRSCNLLGTFTALAFCIDFVVFKTMAFCHEPDEVSVAYLSLVIFLTYCLSNLVTFKSSINNLNTKSPFLIQ